MGEILVKEREIVVPGQILATGMDYLPAGGAYRDEGEVVSSLMGLFTTNGRVLKVIPLRGRYAPKIGDMVIGKVVEMTNSIWFVDIGCYNDGILSLRDVPEYVETGEDLSNFYAYGDYIIAKIVNVSRGNFNLSLKGPGLRKLSKGTIIKVDSAKVPRIIGKMGSMISMIKEKTDCRLIVGQNGTVWIQGEPENVFVATEIIQIINEEGHHEGLTDKIAALLEEKMKKINVAPKGEETNVATKGETK